MKLKKTFNNLSMKWKLFLYFVIFSVVLLALLWIFQIILLEPFYKTIKTNNIKSCAESIAQNIDNSDITTLVGEIANQNDTCIEIYQITDLGYSLVQNVEVNINCIIHQMRNDRLEECYNMATNNNGTYMITETNTTLINGNYFNQVHPYQKGKYGQQGSVIENTQPNEEEAIQPPEEFYEKKPPMDNDGTEGMVYVKLQNDSDGNQYMILLNSIITPVNSTVETLRIQLIIIVAVMLFISLFLSVFVSKRLSKPIININSSAKILATGDYTVKFYGKGYREISELSNTLNYASSELSKVEDLRRELIANISHDLRTPLTMITGYGEVMRDLPGENTPENIQIIIDEANRLSSLISDLMDISKLQAGVQVKEANVYSITDSIASIFTRYNKLRSQDGYNIVFDHTENVLVNADEIKMSQVIYNLVNNAINYAGADKTVILRQKVYNNTVKIEVIDHGKGIPQEQLKYIWDRYYKVDKSHRSAVIGTGLGLSIVKGVLDLHGADYGVLSTQGKGSCFWFTLPVVEKKEDKQE